VKALDGCIRGHVLLPVAKFAQAAQTKAKVLIAVALEAWRNLPWLFQAPRRRKGYRSSDPEAPQH